ncbi:KAR-UP F-box 1, putative [Theobroma cacao]|uniref:KAR-UP F-box 1, putative n=1 Tax=Theobroma cacao TaxID=3641 RepID=A0A061EZV5_THECC|nr:KAR-UP F-box 1, putative [Theobroma cacao]
METIQCSKRPKNGSFDDSDNETLLPGLPDDLAQLCLSSLFPSLLFSVCHSWRRLLYSPSFPPFFSLYALLSPLQNPTTISHEEVAHRNSIEFFSFDPLSAAWRPLPSPPQNPPLHLLHRHPSFLSRKLPIQSLTVSNHLVLIAATTHNFSPALSSPLLFHPESNRWFYGPQISTPRRWCATGAVRGVAYMASGVVGSYYRGDVARSMEQWDLNQKSESWGWENKAQLKDGRFSREAVDAVGYRGKLCMVNVKGNAVKEGAVYNVELDKWEEMPCGMVAGWNGPAATMDEDVIYVIDEVKGSLSKYDDEKDCWVALIELEQLKRAEQIAAGRGKICAVSANGEKIIVVDVGEERAAARFWEVAPPPGFEVVAAHVLPRITRQQ